MFRLLLLIASLGLIGAQQAKPVKQMDAPPPEKKERASDWEFHEFNALGFRYDRQEFIEFDLTDHNLVDTRHNYKGRNTIQFSAGFQSRWRWIVFDCAGAYGWLVDGTYDSVSGVLPISFKGFNIGAGYTADARGALGLRVPLYSTQRLKIFISPAGGYQYNHLMNSVSGEKDSSFAIGIINARLTLRFLRPNQQDWFGPFARGLLEFRFYDRVTWTLFYQYHWPNVRSRTTIDTDLYAYDATATLLLAELNTYNSVLQGQGLKTQLGGTDIKVNASNGWALGAHFEGSSTYSKTCRLFLKLRTEEVAPSLVPVVKTLEQPKVQVKWVQYAASFYADYRF